MQFNLFEQLAGGGAGIWVIAALSVLMITVAIERFHRFRMRAIVPPQLVDEIVPLWQAGRFDDLQQVLARHESVLAKAIRFLAANRARWRGSSPAAASIRSSRPTAARTASGTPGPSCASTATRTCGWPSPPTTTR